jgi:hypothetical protein
MLKQRLNEYEHKPRENVEKKPKSIKKKIKPYTHIHIICKQEK